MILRMHLKFHFATFADCKMDPNTHRMMARILVFASLIFVVIVFCFLKGSPFAAAADGEGPNPRSLVGHLKFVDHPEAKCMDGSRPAYYLSSGYGDGSNKWLIFFQGGGWCYDIERCSTRLRTGYGSSLKYAKQIDMNKAYKSRVMRENPLMYNWNIVYVQYCDSSSFAGDSIHEHKGQTIFFKGRSNRDETIRSLFRQNGTESNMRTATEVVISGCSAGGLAVFLGLDAMAKIVQASAKKFNNHHVAVRGLSDSGFFADVASSVGKASGFYDPVTAKTVLLHKGRRVMDFGACMRDVFDFMNITAGANPACVRFERNKGQASKFTPDSNCVFAHHLAPHIKTPLFLLHPQYDSWQLQYILGSSNASYVNKFGSDSVRAVKTALMHESHPGHGAYIDSCAHHCSQCWGTPSKARPMGEKDPPLNEADAFTVWYKRSLASARDKSTKKHGVVPGINWIVDEKLYPCQDCCHCPPLRKEL